MKNLSLFHSSISKSAARRPAGERAPLATSGERGRLACIFGRLAQKIPPTGGSRHPLTSDIIPARRLAIITLLFLLTFTLRLSAQNVPVPSEPIPDEIPIETSVPAIAPRDPASNPNQEEKITLNFPDTSITQILLNYERLSGKRLIKDVNLQAQNMSLVIAEPVSKREAISIIEATLLLNGFALVPYGENQMKVLNVTAGKNPRSEGVAIYTTPTALPEGDEVVSYFMTFKYRDVTQATQEMQQAILLHQTYGVLVPIPNAQALFITENTSVIRRLIELKELIDVPPSRIVSEFVPLIRADAERVAETLTKMIEAQKAAASGQPGANPGNPVIQNNVAPNPDGTPAVQAATFGNTSDPSFNNLTSGQIQLTADTRTNRILVICRPSSFPYVKTLIQEFDQAAGLTEPLEVALRYVKPSDVLPVLADLLAEDEKDTSGIQQPNTPGQNRTANNGTSRSFGNNTGSNTGSGGGLSRADALDAPAENLGPESRIVGKTRIIADNKAGKIIVIGPPESLQKVRGILTRLDHKPQQVYLSTVIGQLTVGKDDAFGIDYLQSFIGNESGIAGGAINNPIITSTIAGANGAAATTAAFQLPAALNAVTALPALNGLNLYATIADNLSIYVRALESTNRFKVLSRPVVYASNNEKAVISSGSRIAVPRSTLTDTTGNVNGNASVSASIDYEEVVLKLEIIPQINSGNEVTMQIAQVNDSVNGSTTISGNQVPTISTQEVRTTVTVANKNVVVLGGLITEGTSDNRSKIPLLGDIPYLGQLFRSTTKNKTRSELIIFIQPNVVANNDDAQRESRGEEARSVIGQEGRDTAEGLADPTPLPLKKYKK